MKSEDMAVMSNIMDLLTAHLSAARAQGGKAVVQGDADYRHCLHSLSAADRDHIIAYCRCHGYEARFVTMPMLDGIALSISAKGMAHDR